MPGAAAWDPWLNLEEVPPVQTAEFVDYTELPEKVSKSPTSRVLGFLPFAVCGVFIFLLFRNK